MRPDEAPIPLYYRLPLLYIEPVCALNSAYLLLSSPSRFLDAVSPNHPLPSSSSSLSLPIPRLIPEAEAAAEPLASVRILTDMLAIFHLVLAFNMAVVLRMLGPERRVWRAICTGMLLSDALHILACVREFGGWGRSADVAAWRLSDWLNWGILVSMTLVRGGVVLGFGLGTGKAGKSKGR